MNKRAFFAGLAARLRRRSLAFTTDNSTGAGMSGDPVAAFAPAVANKTQTVEFWVKSEVGPNSTFDVIETCDASTSIGFIAMVEAGWLYYYIGPGDGYYRFGAANAVPQGVWTHCAIVHDMSQGAPGYLSGYINGALVGTYRPWTAITNPYLPLVLGAFLPNPFNRHAVGAVDEVRVWATARTSAEIADGVHKSFPELANKQGIIAAWTFDEQLTPYAMNTGALVVRDVSGNGYDLTIPADPTRGVLPSDNSPL